MRTALLVVLVPLLVGGCRFAPPTVRRAMATAYAPSNVYLRQSPLPATIRRVAVLPPTPHSNTPEQLAGAELAGPLLVEELSKRKAFEVIQVSPESLRLLTGNRGWAADDQLPTDLFARLRQATGCDAVLFTSLTTYQPYPPLRMGWRTRLVDCQEQQTWWAMDEVFDAGASGVAAAAEQYARADLNLPNPLLEDTGVLDTPRRFAQYTAHAVASTLPVSILR